MSDHPTIERLADYACGLLPQEGAEEIEAHLPGCRDCAWEVQRRSIEGRRISRALSPEPPEGLAARILEAVPGPRRVLPVSLAAAAALCAVLVGAAVWQHRTTQKTIQRLEEEVASLTASHGREADSGSRIPEGLFRVEMEGSVDEMLAWAKVDHRDEDRLRDALVAAASTTADVLTRASRGEIDSSELVNVDTLGGIEGELRTTLEEHQYSAFVERLDRRSKEAAERAAREFLDDLGASVDLTPDERAQLAAYLIDRTAWRRDESLLPDFVRHHLCASLLRDGNKLSSEARKRIRSEQAGQVMAYLDRADGRYRKLWSRLSGR